MDIRDAWETDVWNIFINFNSFFMSIDLQTDREILINMDGRIAIMDSKLDAFKDALQDIVNSFKELEAVQIADHEKRIKGLEKREDERNGIYKFIMFIIALLGAAWTWLLIKMNIK